MLLYGKVLKVYVRDIAGHIQMLQMGNLVTDYGIN